MPSSLQLLGALAVATTASADLQSASEMTNNCFNFPTENFNRNNAVKAAYGASPQTGGLLNVGDSAFDFTLYDVDGNEYVGGAPNHHQRLPHLFDGAFDATPRLAHLRHVHHVHRVRRVCFTSPYLPTIQRTISATP